MPPRPFVCPVPPSYTGDVLIWDLDRTYLDTRSETLRDLLRTAFQKARDKLDYPGVATLLRALRRTPEGLVRPLYFITASPPQLAEVIGEKFSLDGVEVDGIYFKDNLRNFRPGRFDRLREHIGYKLLALIDLRGRLPTGAVELMFGDDTETDPYTYSLYCEILSGTLDRGALVARLREHGVFRDDAIKVAWRARRIAGRPGMQRIYIQLHKTDGGLLASVGPSIIGTRNYFQTALALHAERRVGIETVAAVGEELIGRGRIGPDDLLRGLGELMQRGVLTLELGRQVADRLIGLGVVAMKNAQQVLQTLVDAK